MISAIEIARERKLIWDKERENGTKGGFFLKKKDKNKPGDLYKMGAREKGIEGKIGRWRRREKGRRLR